MRHRFHAALLAVCLLPAVLSAGCARAPELDLAAELESLVQAELSFARAAGEKGMREAFLEYLAEESVLFRPNPVDGREWFRAAQPTDALLSWYPSQADISRDGRLGYTTGPYEYRAEGVQDPAVRHGNYVSIWRKQADGSWRVILDMGVSHPAPEMPPAAWQASSFPAETEGKIGAVSGQEAVLALTEADRAASSGDTPGNHIAAGARMLRNGEAPRLGKASFLGGLPESRPGWHPLRAEVSPAGDLGYTFGRDDAGNVHYLRIWKREPGAPWLIVLELSS